MAPFALVLSCVPPAADFADWPLADDGYEIEPLPIVLTASFARGDNVHWGLPGGEVVRVKDSDLDAAALSLGNPFGADLRMLFVSESGTVFASAGGLSTMRLPPGASQWEPSLDIPVWRMDQDDQGNLYAGNYIKDDQHVATVYKSVDDGRTWSPIFSDPRNHHVHTVRWDDRSKRLYIAFGDAASRGQALSDDRGDSFYVIASGRRQGHTDVAFTKDFIFWCSDDQSGRTLRTARQGGQTQTLTSGSQFVWFGVAAGEQVYVGTVTSRAEGGERAALLASPDQGRSWQKLLETPVSNGPYERGFFAESRELSAGGWLYCSGSDQNGSKSYRIRRRPDPDRD